MKKIILLLASYVLLGHRTTQAQAIIVPEVIQEQNQWCWAGVSKCILDYYGYPQQQCDIAEYARTVITWSSFGQTNCCVNPNVGCNYWNYNYGYPGSIEDILEHFGNIQNYGSGNSISLSQAATECAGGRPFVVRWGWNTGGGHFVVGHGVNGNDVYYMNPWFGEGLHVSTYNWLVNDGTHFWTHTNILTTSPTGIQQIPGDQQTVSLYPNPSNGRFNVHTTGKLTTVEIFTILGENIFKANVTDINQPIDISGQAKGMYFVKFTSQGNTFSEKLILE